MKDLLQILNDFNSQLKFDYHKKMEEGPFRKTLLFSEKMKKNFDFIDYQQILKNLSKSFVFRFNLTRILKSDYFQVFQSLIKQVYCLMLLLIQPKKQEQVVKISEKIKEIYCILLAKINKQKRYEKIDIIFLLLSLSSRRFFQIIFEKPERTLEEYYSKDQLTIQSYTYMILIYETTGNMVSPLTLNCLIKRYIKRFLFKSTISEEPKEGLFRSLKYIQRQLKKQNTVVTSRGDIFDQGSKRHFQKFLKLILKAQVQEKQNTERKKDEVTDIFQRHLQENTLLKDQQQLKTKQVSILRSKSVKPSKLSEAAKYYYKLDEFRVDSNTNQSLKDKIKSKSLKTNLIHEKNYQRNTENLFRFKKHVTKTQSSVQKDWKKVILQMKNKQKSQFVLERFSNCHQQGKVQSIKKYEKGQKQQLKLTSKLSEIFNKNTYKIEKKKPTLKFFNINENQKDKSSRNLPKIKKTSSKLKRMREEFDKKCKNRLDSSQIKIFSSFHHVH